MKKEISWIGSGDAHTTNRKRNVGRGKRDAI